MCNQIDPSRNPGLVIYDVRNVVCHLLDDFLNWKVKMELFTYGPGIVVVGRSISNSAFSRQLTHVPYFRVFPQSYGNSFVILALHMANYPILHLLLPPARLRQSQWSTNG